MSANLQGFPLGTAAPWKNGDPFLGGQIVILPVAVANANTVITHNLRRLPRAYLVLDIGIQTFPILYGGNTGPPFGRGSTAWTFAVFSLNLPALTAAVTGVLL
jgi:hypothetical protein